MTLHERIQLLVLGFLVVLGLTAAVGVVSVGRRDQLVERAMAYDRAADGANGMLISYLTGDGAGASSLGDNLRVSLSDDPGALALLDKAEALPPQSLPALRGAFTALRTDLENKEAAANDELGRARRQINIALLIAFVDGAALLVAVSVALRRWSTTPLLEITAAVREVTGGALDHRIPAVGPADIADLGRDAELMRRRIVAELDSARRAEQALRSQGAIVSVLRNELGPSGEGLPETMAMAAGFEPVKGVLAGDWYDVLPLEDGTVALCLIDVSGHGQSTGVFALQAKNLLVAGARQLSQPGDVLAFLSRALGDTGDHFLTCFMAKIDPATGACFYASAGHLPALLTHDRAVQELPPTGPLLGPLPGAWETRSAQFSPGSLLVAYTDGVTEARGRGAEEFGEERLRAVVAARAGEHPTNVVTTCLDSVHDFSKGDATDDLTIVALRWLPGT